LVAIGLKVALLATTAALAQNKKFKQVVYSLSTLGLPSAPRGASLRHLKGTFLLATLLAASAPAKARHGMLF